MTVWLVIDDDFYRPSFSVFMSRSTLYHRRGSTLSLRIICLKHIISVENEQIGSAASFCGSVNNLSKSKFLSKSPEKAPLQCKLRRLKERHIKDDTPPRSIMTWCPGAHPRSVVFVCYSSFQYGNTKRWLVIWTVGCTSICGHIRKSIVSHLRVRPYKILTPHSLALFSSGSDTSARWLNSTGWELNAPIRWDGGSPRPTASQRS